MVIHDRSWVPRWTRFIILHALMASMASALSLSQFQPITSARVPRGCILVYNAEIPGCGIRDFSEGSNCSPSCVRGLRMLEYALQLVCEDADVSPASLLGQVLEGNLEAILCPDRSSPPPGTTTATTTTTTTTTTSTPTPTTIITTTTRPATTRPTQISFTTVQPPSTTLTRSTIRTETETDTETEEPTTSTSSTSTSSTTAVVTSDNPLPTTFIQSTSSTTASSSSTSSSKAAEETDRNRGGTDASNPFELTLTSSSSTRHIPRWVITVAISIAVSFLFL
ncbi:hypothetical protein VTH82DRAFT_1033 [Thermothelomyces myriococcoides]